MSTSKPQSLAREGSRALRWTSFGTLTRAIVQFAALVILARLLAPEAFGIMAIAEATINLSIIISQLGVGPFLVQRKDIQDDHVAVANMIVLVIGLVFAAALLLSSGVIAAFFNQSELEGVLVVMAAAIIFMNVASVPQHLMMRNFQFRVLTLVEAGSYLVGFGLVGIGLALYGAGVWALVLAFVAQTLFAAVALLILSPSPWRLSFDGRVIKEFLVFGFGQTLAQICNQSAQQLDKIIAGRLLDAASVGLYARAQQLIVLPASLFGHIVERVLFPVLSTIQDDQQRLRHSFIRGTATTALAVMPFSVLLFILAPEVISLLFGPNWSGAVMPLQLMAVAVTFRVSYKISDSLARAKAAVYRRAWRQLVFATMVMTGTWFGAETHGINGVAIGLSCAIIGNYLLMTDLSCRLLDLPYVEVVKAHAQPVALTVLTGIVGYLTADAVRDVTTVSILIILASGAASAAAGIGAIYLAPAVFLGDSGRWSLGLLQQNLLPATRTESAD